MQPRHLLAVPFFRRILLTIMSPVTVLLLLGLTSSALATFHFQYSDCSSSPNKIARVENAHISPDPVVIPGTEKGDVTVHILRPISGHHFKVDLKIIRDTFIDITVPCISNVGSCSYDVCSLLSSFNDSRGVNHCPVEIARSSPNFDCSCPFDVGTYRLNPTTFQIPKLAGIWSWIASGDYRLHAEVTDTNTHEKVGCWDAKVTTSQACGGFFSCLIG